MKTAPNKKPRLAGGPSRGLGRNDTDSNDSNLPPPSRRSIRNSRRRNLETGQAELPWYRIEPITSNLIPFCAECGVPVRDPDAKSSDSFIIRQNDRVWCDDCHAAVNAPPDSYYTGVAPGGQQ